LPSHSAMELPPFVNATTNSHSSKSGKIMKVRVIVLYNYKTM
jgi:hypothetical protein